MKVKFKAISLIMAFIFMMSVFQGCGTEKEFSFSYPTEAEDSEVYVEAIPEITDNFVRGMDASAVKSLENSGVKYYGFDGKEQDVYKTLAESGVNSIRLRVWNDPYDENGNGYGGGNCDVDTAIELGSRATKYGMKVCIDFHYSDFWADPKRQHAPKAWEGMTVSEKCDALYDFTCESLTKMLDAGLDISMVQIGNEINYGMSGVTNTDDKILLLKSGSKAVREISAKYNKDIKVAVHFTKIDQTNGINKIAKKLEESELDYDVFGLSYYTFWDGTIENMQNVVYMLKNTYKKEVMIVETSYAYTMSDGDGNDNNFKSESDIVEGYVPSVQSQASMIRDVIAAALSAGASGVYYWEGTWIPVGPASEKGNNSVIWEKYGSGWASSYASDYDPDEAGLYYGGCSWDNQAMFDHTGHPLESLKVFKYLKYGTTEGSAKYKYTKKGLFEYTAPETVIEEPETENYVKNASFESDDYSMWTVTYTSTNNTTDFFLKPEDAYDGDMSFHFFTPDEDAEFSIEQTITGLENGTYVLSAYAQGGDTATSSMFKLYAITENGKKESLYSLTTWCDWKNPTVKNIEVTDGTVTIGVYGRTNKGSWGTIDLIKLNKVSD